MKKTTPTSLVCWCGGELASTRVQTETFSLLHCPMCGSFKIDPPPISREDESGDFYTTYYASRHVGRSTTTGVAGQHSRYWRVVRQVPELCAPSRMVIDFGSGDGGLCHELAQAGWEDVLGVDISRARVARARQSFPSIRFYDRPLPQTDIALASADLCVMDNVIEHLTAPQTVLKELRHYIKPGGKIVVITPNMESGTFRLLGKRWTPELAPHAHIFLFTPAALSRVMTEAGFAVQTVGTFHEPPYSMRQWTRRLFTGDVKGALWRAHQELGALYSRIVGAGPMVYVVAVVPAERATGAGPLISAPVPRTAAVSQGGAG